MLCRRRQALGKETSQSGDGGVIKSDGGGQLNAKLGTNSIPELNRTCTRGRGQTGC